MRKAKVEITAGANWPMEGRVVINGEDISHLVCHVEVEMDVNGTPMVFLKLIPDEMQLTANGEVYKLP